MPELRIDPIVGRKVLVAEDRDGRPFDYARLRDGAARLRPSVAECSFCHDHESETPPAVAERCDDQGRWLVRVVPNKFPALSLAAPIDEAFGAHEVVIESPNHDRDWTELSVDQVAAILAMHRDRLRHWSADDRIKHGLVFKNSGFAAGASLEHVHSQLIATSRVADVVQAELDACRKFHSQTGQRLFDELLAGEVAAGERLVIRHDGYAAFCAYAGRQPFETWLVPEESAARFETADDRQIDQLAAIARDLLLAMQQCMPEFSYNLILHNGPFDGAFDDVYRWHWEILPRRSQFAGIEMGGGYFINSVSPERAASKLRDAITGDAGGAQSRNPAKSSVR